MTVTDIARTNKSSRITVALLAAMLMVLAGGCGGKTADEPGDAQLGALEIKHAIAVDDVLDPLPPGHNNPAPGSGMRHAMITVTIVNQSSQEFIFSPANLKLETQEGGLYSYNIDFDGEEALAAVNTISPGAELTGAIVYDIPGSERPKTLVENIGGIEARIELPAASS